MADLDYLEKELYASWRAYMRDSGQNDNPTFTEFARELIPS